MRSLRTLVKGRCWSTSLPGRSLAASLRDRKIPIKAEPRSDINPRLKNMEPAGSSQLRPYLDAETDKLFANDIPDRGQLLQDE